MRLPHLESLDEYRAIYHDEDVWLPAIDEICRRHALAGAATKRGPDGTHIVYYAEPSLVIKLFVPLFGDDFAVERAAMRHVQGRLSISVPSIVWEGKVWGWPYLVMSRMAGRRLGDIWDGIGRENRLALVREVGELVTTLRALPTEGLPELAVDWDRVVAEQVSSCVDRQREHGAPEGIVAGIPGYLTSAPPLYDEGFRPVLLLADITDEHVYVSERDGRWRMTGYLDFGDAMLGHPDYEMVAPGIDIARCDAGILRALLLASGYDASRLDDALRHRLMAYTLLHRYVNLKEIMGFFPETRDAATLEELAHALWPVDVGGGEAGAATDRGGAETGDEGAAGETPDA